MRIYTAQIHPTRPPALVPEAFSWGALFFGPLWLLRHGAWIPAVLAAVAFALAITVVPPPARPAATLGVLVALGLFGNDLRRWSLGRAGYALAHVVAARSQDEAEFRLLSHVPSLRRLPT